MTLAFHIILLVCVLVFVYRHQCLLRDRAELMRDAMRHRDFSFYLPTRGLLFGESALQEVLNDMGGNIQKLVARNEVESWQRLIRVLTHEIMNATTPIRSISQAYLAKPGIQGTPYAEGIRTIRDMSGGLAAFVDSYRQLTLLPEPVQRDFNLLSFCNTIRHIFPHVRWDMDVPRDVIIHADENLLRQVFVNIVKNAIEAGASAISFKHLAPARVQRRYPSAFCRLHISNNGHTIPDEVATEIFVPFFTTKPHGSGIGPALSRQILMMQNFALSLAERPAPGHNVTFVIENLGLRY